MEGVEKAGDAAVLFKYIIHPVKDRNEILKICTRLDTKCTSLHSKTDTPHNGMAAQTHQKSHRS